MSATDKTADEFAAAAVADTRDEPLPFLSNFQDVFLATGVIALLVGLLIGGVSVGTTAKAGGAPVLVLVLSVGMVIALVALGLSEVLVRARRRVLPGIVLCLAYLAATMAVFAAAYGQLLGEEVWDGSVFGSLGEPFLDAIAVAEPESAALREATGQAAASLPLSVRLAPTALIGAGLAAAFAYYRRYRLPFASALVGAGAVSLVLTMIFTAVPFDASRAWPILQLLAGLALFTAGLAFDMKDPERVTRFAGNGFWLHLFAAPVVLGGALSVVQHGPLMKVDEIDVSEVFSVAQSVTTLCVIALFGLVSLLINRRALVVSGLISAGVAIGVIVSHLGLGSAGVAAATLCLLGGGVVLLGIGWNAARAAVLAPLPEGGVWGRVFPRTSAAG